ncbi:MAG: hypothetical protein J4F39_13830 [Candidatus Latescibacteria bacterium]|nr:hypothetical protein [Candidatus Latescibacterota bacterium]
MNRRLLRTTYHAEVEVVNFTHGLPAWMTQSLTGSSRASTYDYTDPYGSHYAMVPSGNAGEGVTLAGSPICMSVAKVLELEAVGVTVAGPTELTLGLVSPNDGVAGIQLQAAPIDAGAAPAGRVRLLLRDGSSEGEQTLFAEGNDGQIHDGGTVIDDVDLGVIVDIDAKTAQAHLGYSYVSCGPEGFPDGQVLAPAIRTALVADGKASAKVRRMTIGIYT